MVYKYVIPTLCIFSTMSLYAEQKELGDIIQNAGEEQVLIKPVTKKKVERQTRFVFKDEYSDNGIGRMDKTSKEKSKSYEYENKSRFKFKFNDGSQQSNLIGGYGSSSIGGGMAGGAQSSSGGGGRR